MRMLASGKIGIGATNPQARLTIHSSDLVTLTNPGFLILGDTIAKNMALDNSVIQARNNATASPLSMTVPEVILLRDQAELSRYQLQEQP